MTKAEALPDAATDADATGVHGEAPAAGTELSEPKGAVWRGARLSPAPSLSLPHPHFCPYTYFIPYCILVLIPFSIPIPIPIPLLIPSPSSFPSVSLFPSQSPSLSLSPSPFSSPSPSLFSSDPHPILTCISVPTLISMPPYPSLFSPHPHPCPCPHLCPHPHPHSPLTPLLSLSHKVRAPHTYADHPQLSHFPQPP